MNYNRVLMIAISLGLYLAERIDGPFKNSFLTFSETPELVKINPKHSLVDKISFEILEENEQDFINSVEDEIKRIKENCKYLP